MSRLTKRTVIGVVIRTGDTSDAIKRLADYEDAEEQGRLVPVVRCHECAYRDKDWWSEERVHCELHSEEPDQMYTGFDMIMPKDGYCSYGEREEPPV